ncbi:hypothetical protein AAEO57_07365, partial [Flavobacterium sp. DGU38]
KYKCRFSSEFLKDVRLKFSIKNSGRINFNSSIYESNSMLFFTNIRIFNYCSPGFVLDPLQLFQDSLKNVVGRNSIE